MVTCEMKLHWVYRAMIENRMNQNPSSNHKTEDRIERYHSIDFPEKNSSLRPHRGVYVLKEKHVYYFTSRDLSEIKLNPVNILNKYAQLKKDTSVNTSFNFPRKKTVKDNSQEFESQENTHPYILSHGDYNTNYSYVTEKGVFRIGDCQENSAKIQIPLIHRLLTVLRQCYISPILVSVDSANDLSPISNYPETEGQPKIDPSPSEADPLVENTESKSDSSAAHSKLNVDDIDDETFEYLSLLEYEEDIKEQPRDVLFNRIWNYKDNYPLQVSEDGDLSKFPDERCKDDCDPSVNQDMFSSHFIGGDVSSGEGFSTDPIFRDFDSKWKSGTADDPGSSGTCVPVKCVLSLMMFVRGMFHCEDWKNVYKFVKS